ncbi:MAG TPA: hypothetical protein VIG24_08985 [Acidimicrobiia bacterium]
MDGRLINVVETLHRLRREVSDAEWVGDPRSTQLACELKTYEKLHAGGVQYEPRF